MRLIGSRRVTCHQTFASATTEDLHVASVVGANQHATTDLIMRKVGACKLDGIILALLSDFL